MGRFDKYLLSQLMVLFGFFSLVLVLVYWVNRAVVLFDQLIANGQSAGVFLEFTALSLPNVIRLVLPIAAFAAVVYVANRLSSESELVVVQATGYSPYRLARPVLVFGVIVAVLVSVLTHVLVPRSLAKLAERQDEIAENITARFLTEGTFTHPANGITFYIREISAQGELQDVFLSDARSNDRRTTYTARRALLIRSESGPKLVMFEGLAQTLRSDDQRLSTTSFDDFAFDIGALIDRSPRDRRGLKELSTFELLNPTDTLMAETRSSAAEMLYEGHGRVTQALLSIVAVLVGFATMLVGGFSRFGLWRQIMGAIVALVLLKSLDNTMADVVRRDEALWPVAYTATIAGLGVALALFWISARPGLFRKRAEVPA